MDTSRGSEVSLSTSGLQMDNLRAELRQHEALMADQKEKYRQIK